MLAKGVASRSLALIGILAIGLLIAYGNFPQAHNPQGQTPDTANEVKAPGQVAVNPRGDDQRTAASAATPPAGVTAALPPPSPPSAVASSRVASRESGEPGESSAATLASAPVAESPQATVTQSEQWPGAQPTLPASSAEPDAQQFVPVLFTHKDKAAAERAYGALSVRYPKLLRGRHSQVQAVDIGGKGVWHRLVVLPPGSHQEAGALCAQLQAAGYDRCWVKAY